MGKYLIALKLIRTLIACLVLLCLVLSCLVLSCLVLSCLVLSKDLLDKDLEEHLTHAQPTHLHLALVRMKEHEKVISTMHRKVDLLETTSKTHGQRISELTMGVAAGATALAVSEKRMEKAFHDQVYKLDQKISRSTSAISTTNSDLNKLQRTIQDVQRAIQK